MAEWLRRLSRNQIPSGSVGSSPADREVVLVPKPWISRQDFISGWISRILIMTLNFVLMSNTDHSETELT